MEGTGEGQGQEEELQRFDDFTLASSWERFISDIESVVRLWLADGPKNLLEKGAVHLGLSRNLYKVTSELKYAMKSYFMEYYFETNNDAKEADWTCTLHDLQLSFGVKEFLVIAPQSASRVILDAPEASKLLSTVAIALSNCSSFWPAFVPVHDPSRRAYIGVQNMGTVFTRRFEADRIGSQVPVKLMHLEGLYELFVSKFGFSTMEISMHLLKVHFTMKLTYRTLSHEHDDDDDEIQEADAETTSSSDVVGVEPHKTAQWDDDCPWSEWFSAEDPVKGFELTTIWLEKLVESSLEMAELENDSPHEAEKWILVPKISSNLINDESEANTVGFASQLHLLVDALNISFEAQFMEDFVSVENSTSDSLRSSTVIPPPTVLDRVLKDLFHEGVQIPNFQEDNHKSSRMIKGAPLDSLFAQFCLHSLWLGNCNIRAIAVLWIEFVREVRWCWEESQPLPGMAANDVIDLSTCLVNQKLQMLATCIEKKRKLHQDSPKSIESKVIASALIEEGGLMRDDSPNRHTPTEGSDGMVDSLLTPDNFGDSGLHLSGLNHKPNDVVVSANPKSSDHMRTGSAGMVGSMMLLNSYQNMHAPFTQNAPIMTEDMHEERLQAVEAFGDSVNFSAQLERDILTSDMSAFKAANPDAVFEDFIRWHSPGDWEDNFKGGRESGSHAAETLKDSWPPQGRLSKRMSEHGNLWRRIWNGAPALPASEQKPLLDPCREGEKILHYLETLRPQQLLKQMICTAFRASADTLNQANFGGFKQMKTKIEQLYLTIASTLKPLQVNSLSDCSEIIEDLKRLCVVFGHVEKLLILAVSLHRKFLKAPRLSEAMFGEYYKFYLPRMGMGSGEGNANIEFCPKQQVMNGERRLVSNMFTPPTANQSWRKVLSMGNLLNGHEPILREVIFSTREEVNRNHYAASTPTHRQDIETYRMYISGTSNDLRVTLSVTSGD